MKNKILFIHHGRDIGGAALSLLYLIEKVRCYYEVKVLFIYNSSVVRLFEKKGIEYKILNSSHPLFIHSQAGRASIIHAIKLIHVFWGWFQFAFFYSKKVLAAEKPDILHLNSTFLTEWAYAAKKLNIPVIVHVREPLAEGVFGFRRMIIRKILKFSASKIIAISLDNSTRIGLPELTTVSYNFVDFKQFDPTLHEKNEGNIWNVAYLGGQAEIKGFNWLVDSLKHLEKNIRVVFAGYYSNEKMTLSSKIKGCLSQRKRRTRNNLRIMSSSANAVEVGVVDDIPRFLGSCDLLVFPSTVPHFARPVIEANAMKIPVVISKLPGNDEIVTDGVNGLSVTVNDPVELAEKINMLCHSQALLKKMGENGFLIARDRFDSEKNISEVLRVYQEVLNRP